MQFRVVSDYRSWLWYSRACAQSHLWRVLKLDVERLQGGEESEMVFWISREIICRHGGGNTICRSGKDNVGTLFSIKLHLFAQTRLSKKYIGNGPCACWQKALQWRIIYNMMRQYKILRTHMFPWTAWYIAPRTSTMEMWLLWIGCGGTHFVECWKQLQ